MATTEGRNKEFMLHEFDGEVKCYECGSQELHFLAMVDTNGDPVTVYCEGHYCTDCHDERRVIPLTEKSEAEKELDAIEEYKKLKEIVKNTGVIYDCY